jgi:predicted amidohydrolase YtcJ
VTENTQQLFRDAAFPPTVANQDTAYESLLDALDKLRRNGITSVSDAGGFWRQAQTESWKRALDNGMLTVKASNSLYIYPDRPIDEQLPGLVARYSNDKTSRLRFNQAKIYVDGILELTTAALYEPYLDTLGLGEDERLGFEYFESKERLMATAATLVSNGFQLFFHVVGDRAAGIALDAIAALPTNDHGPHRLTHCYLVDERDRGRFVTLGVNADFQMAPSTLEQDYIDFLTTSIVGDTRAKALQPIRAIHDTGATVTLSSDWDADELSPLTKIQIGMGILSDLHAVLDMLTINGAKVLQQDSRTGSIAIGKDADFIVLDRDIFTVPTTDIAQAQVVLTVLEGDIVFDLDRDGPAVEVSRGTLRRLGSMIIPIMSMLCCFIH